MSWIMRESREARQDQLDMMNSWDDPVATVSDFMKMKVANLTKAHVLNPELVHDELLKAIDEYKIRLQWCIEREAFKKRLEESLK